MTVPSSQHHIAVQATKAQGVVVRVEREAFRQILSRSAAPLVVRATAGWRGHLHGYLTSYKGLAFYCKTDDPLDVTNVEWIDAESIWLPSM